MSAYDDYLSERYETIDVGPCHVLVEPGGPCVPKCDHPDHWATPSQRWGTCCPDDPECEHSFIDVDQLARWMETPIHDDDARRIVANSDWNDHDA